MSDPIQHEVEWEGLDQEFSGLATGNKHQVLVKREAIPIVFVPGIMGTRLRAAGTRPPFPYPDYEDPEDENQRAGEGERVGADLLPLLRWDPDSQNFTLRHYNEHGTPAYRRRMMIGPTRGRFSPGYLEPDDADPRDDPADNGRQSLLTMSYDTIFEALRNRDWGPLAKVFDFPVYGFGYNWTDTCRESGRLLAERITKIKAKEKQRVGRCEHVIVVTHSMGGLVSRSASKLHGGEGDILGIVHGVQPVLGSAVAYWRIKAGFEKGPGGGFKWVKAFWVSEALGKNGRQTTVLLGNMPGGLELLPTKHYPAEWLRVTQGGNDVLVLPAADPYAEIYRLPYRQPDEYWRLVDDALLDPDRPAATPPAAGPDDPNALGAGTQSAPFNEYLDYLTSAEGFHDDLGLYPHPKTYTLHGTGLSTAGTIELQVESNWVREERYPVRGFRGIFQDENQKDMQAVLQEPSGDGDGTVPVASATALDDRAQDPPAPLAIQNGGHEPIYQEDLARDFVFRAIEQLCQAKLDGRSG